MQLETKPDLMPQATAQPSSRAGSRFSGEDLARWAWTEPSVWTNSMLTTLEFDKVRGGKWHSLIDKVYHPKNLYSAYREVAANRGAPGVDHVTIEATIADVNRTLRGWFEYFKHSWRTTFPELDSWIRGRLRSILRKRAGRQGRGRGLDNHRYPNQFFADLGLFSLTTAYHRECQPCLR